MQSQTSLCVPYCQSLTIRDATKSLQQLQYSRHVFVSACAAQMPPGDRNHCSLAATVVFLAKRWIDVHATSPRILRGLCKDASPILTCLLHLFFSSRFSRLFGSPGPSPPYGINKPFKSPLKRQKLFPSDCNAHGDIKSLDVVQNHHFPVDDMIKLVLEDFEGGQGVTSRSNCHPLAKTAADIF